MYCHPGIWTPISAISSPFSFYILCLAHFGWIISFDRFKFQDKLLIRAFKNMPILLCPISVRNICTYMASTWLGSPVGLFLFIIVLCILKKIGLLISWLAAKNPTPTPLWTKIPPPGWKLGLWTPVIWPSNYLSFLCFFFLILSSPFFGEELPKTKACKMHSF